MRHGLELGPLPPSSRYAGHGISAQETFKHGHVCTRCRKKEKRGSCCELSRCWGLACLTWSRQGREMQGNTPSLRRYLHHLGRGAGGKHCCNSAKILRSFGSSESPVSYASENTISPIPKINIVIIMV